MTDDAIAHDTLAILKRLSRKPIEPAPDLELMADLGFDSLLVMELVGELEEHFDIDFPDQGADLDSGTLQDLIDAVDGALVKKQAKAG